MSEWEGGPAANGASYRPHTPRHRAAPPPPVPPPPASPGPAAPEGAGAPGALAGRQSAKTSHVFPLFFLTTFFFQ